MSRSNTIAIERLIREKGFVFSVDNRDLYTWTVKLERDGFYLTSPDCSSLAEAIEELELFLIDAGLSELCAGFKVAG